MDGEVRFITGLNGDNDGRLSVFEERKVTFCDVGLARAVTQLVTLVIGASFYA